MFKWAEGRGPFSKPLAETSLFQNAPVSKKYDDDTLLAALAERGLVGLTIEDLGKLNPPDEFETELRIMAEVRGYFQVAFKVRIEVSPPGLATFSKSITNSTALIFFPHRKSPISSQN